MSPKQKKLAAKAPPPNKIDEKDFAVLRAEKAKGRGMGLQDEKVQPGKVMKANKGKLGEAKDYKKYLKGLKKTTSEVRGAKLNSPAYNITTYDQKSYEKAGGKGKAVFKDYKGLGIKNEDQYFKEKNASKFMKRRKKLAGSKLPGRIGTALGAVSMLVPAAYAAAKQYKDYKSAKNRDKAKVKKMGGGMMKKYSKGGGADSGRIGEMKSRLAVAMDKLAGGYRKSRGKVSPRDYDKITERTKTYIKAESKKNTDRLTDRDIKKASSLVKGKMPKAIAQGKTKKVMIHDMMPADTAMRTGSPMPRYSKGGGHYDDKNKNVVKHIRIKKKMGGGMIGPSQRPGYSKGTMVKARGCKLGRTRPTKIT